MTTIGIFGTSGLAREVGDVADAMGLAAVYVARDAVAAAAWRGVGEVMLEADIGRLANVSFVIGVGDPATRALIAARYRNTITFANLIHPTTSFGRGQREVIERQVGTVIFAGARLSNAITIGDFVLINPNATIGHDVDIGDFVTICPGANVSGNVCIGSCAWIGAGAVINQGTPERARRVGEGAVVGSGAVVVSDCEDSATYAGVPARKMP